MSALITAMLMRKRATQAQIAASEKMRDEIIAKAKGDKGDSGDKGSDGVGISDVDIKEGYLYITFSNGKKKKIGKVVQNNYYTSVSNAVSSSQSEPSGDIPKLVEIYNQEKGNGLLVQSTPQYPDRDLLTEYILSGGEV